MHLSGRHVLVLGLGESGLAMAQWCIRQGARVRVADTREMPPCLDEMERTIPGAGFVAGAFDKSLLEGIDLLALSPGVSAGLMVVIHARAAAIPVVGEIELFAWGLAALGVREKTRILAITGTNGKTTTTALTAHLCRSGGHTALAAGNISPAALHALMGAQDAGEMPDFWVLELSSFQLETLSSLNADAATVLNISDDHLDRYIDLDEYAGAKARIFQGHGVQVLNRDDVRSRRMAIAGRRQISFGLDLPAVEHDFGMGKREGADWIVQGSRFLLPLTELPLAGLHNAANAMAALALCQAAGLATASLLPGLRTFQGLPHRVEKVLEAGGVTYYDDSKGTNVGATVAALEGLQKPVLLIAGGDGKGQDFSPLRAAVSRFARAVILIGRDGPVIGAAIEGSGIPVRMATDMEEAVRLAAEMARSGDAVLLSPACASFDMYRNYEHRARVYVDAVRRIAGGDE
ncbi:MAG: UDP-N-acetylmuramoyl-L-alanine--D-glutamate ligase [Proteobacteria bacterium]|nr:UDP-N-acetylmuramoyl-L-alanine--D-glutamate ligase [Pseudomonadota bacterium]HQR04369.1 UDP-N-acetylmuramoyl-L-alanine--D-glutamate ligase [Rhodocyclaceae bacterium]